MSHWYFFFSPFFLCIFRCAVSSCFDLKLSVHKSQGKLRSWCSFVVCLFLCADRWCFRRKFCRQISHSNRRSRSWIWTCAFKALFSVHTNSHILHLNCLLEHTFSCACREPSSWKRSLQNVQWNGSSERCRLRCLCFEKERERKRQRKKSTIIIEFNLKRVAAFNY